MRGRERERGWEQEVVAPLLLLGLMPRLQFGLDP